MSVSLLGGTNLWNQILQKPTNQLKIHWEQLCSPLSTCSRYERVREVAFRSLVKLPFCLTGYSISILINITQHLRKGDQPSNPLNKLPVVLFCKICVYLEPDEVCILERINHSIRGIINNDVNNIWRSQCTSLGIPVAPTPVLSLKRWATIPRGVITPKHESFYTRKANKDIDGYQHVTSWGTSEPEICLEVCVKSKQSVKECETLHEHSPPPSIFDTFARTWHSHVRNASDKSLRLIHYSRLPCPFPKWIPLRLFINPDGSFKKEGDKLYLILKNQPIVLTCGHYTDIAISDDEKRITSFSEGITQRIKLNCHNLGLVTACINLYKSDNFSSYE